MSELPRSLQALKNFAATVPQKERCDLCGASIPDKHDHVFSLQTRQLDCTCMACALLFSGQPGADGTAGQRVRVPHRAQKLPDFSMTDALWNDLRLPVELAFFVRSSAAKRVVAYYPSPAGANEALLPVEGWAELLAANPTVSTLAEDVEALLVQEVARRREAYLVSIDECYALTGLLRKNWRGLSGGEEVWRLVKSFFHRLRGGRDA